VRRRGEAMDVLVGGRHLGAPGDAPVTFVLSLDGVDAVRWQASPGFFLEQFTLPAGAVAGDGLAALAIHAISPQGGSSPTAIEQFDAQNAGVLMWGYDSGWHEAEFSPAIGVWRWTSDRATLRVVNAHAPVALTLQIESPLRNFDAPPTVRVRAGEQLLEERQLSGDVTWRLVVPAEALQRSHGRITIETDRTFVPAETSGVADARRLGLRVFAANVSFEH